MTTSSSRRIRFQSGHTTIKNGKAIAAGLAFRPLAGTVKDTLAWWATVSEERRAKPRFIINTGNRSKSAFGLESERLGTGLHDGSPCAPGPFGHGGLSCGGCGPRDCFLGCFSMASSQ